MGTSAQDQKTQAAASTGAQQQDQQLADNAVKNQAFSDQSRSTLFGTYNPTTGRYEGGTESASLDPNSLNTQSLTGAFKNEYNTIADQNAKTATNAVGTTMQNLASRGLGKTPTGFSADQQRKAYQDQTDSNANAYSGLFGQQHDEAVNQYNNANNLLSSNATGAANLSLGGNSAAASNYSGLYGTASQQKQNALGGVMGLVGGAGNAAISKYCWIAAEIYGGWNEPRTVAIREWLHSKFSKTLIGSLILKLYMKHGEKTAPKLRTSKALRMILIPTFNLALHRALEAR